MPLGKTGIEFGIGKYNIRIVFRSFSERTFVCVNQILSGLLQVFNDCLNEIILPKLLGRQAGSNRDRSEGEKFSTSYTQCNL
jgi:hypothetical protein